jgi:hypothetical protein
MARLGRSRPIQATVLHPRQTVATPVLEVLDFTIPASEVDADITAMKVKFDLSLITNTAWWNDCNGQNIQIRTTGGVPLPQDIATVDIDAHTGRIWFLTDLSSSVDNEFTIGVYDGLTPYGIDHPLGRNAVHLEDAFVDAVEMVNRTGGPDPVLVGAEVVYYTSTQEISTSLFQQGVAWDGSDWYGTGGANNKRIARVDGTTELEEVAVADASAAAVIGGGSAFDHIAGCVVYNSGSGNELYVLADDYPSISNQLVQVWNVSTLAYVRQYDLEASRPGDQNSDICWNDNANLFVLSDYNDGEVLHTYDDDFNYVGDLTLPAPIGHIQGIEWSNGFYFIMTGPQVGASYLYKVADDMSTSVVVWSGAAHSQGIAGKDNTDSTPDLWYGDSSGDLRKLTYSTPAVTPTPEHINLGGAGHYRIDGLPKRTVWTMGASVRLGQIPSGNYAVVSYGDNTTANTTRETIAARDAPDEWALWNSNDSWLSGPSISGADVGTTRGLNATHDTTVDRTLFFNGAPGTPDSTVVQKPTSGGSTVSFYMGGEDNTGDEELIGAMTFAYVRDGESSNARIAFEHQNWRSTGTIVVDNGVSDLAPLDTRNSHTSDSPTITQVHAIAPVDSSHGNTSESPTVTQVHVIAPLDSSHGNTAESPAITQVHAVEPLDTENAHTSDSPAITQVHAIEPVDTENAHTSDSPAITQVHAIEPLDTENAHTSDSPTVAHIHHVNPVDTSNAHTSDSPTVTQVHLVEPDDTSNAHTSDTTTVTQVHVVTPLDSEHGNTSESPSITQVHVVEPLDTENAHISDSPTVVTEGDIAPEDTRNSHTSDSPTVTQLHLVEPLDTENSHTSDSPTVIQNHVITPLDSSHSHTSDSPTVAQVHVITPNDTSNSHTTSESSVSVPHEVQPDSTENSHTSSEPDISIPSEIQPDDTSNSHTSGSPLLDQPPPPHDRMLVVRPSDRIHEVNRNARTHRVPASTAYDDRTLTVGARNRTYVVPEQERTSSA